MEPGIYQLLDSAGFFVQKPNKDGTGYLRIGDVDTENVLIEKGDVVLVIGTTRLMAQSVFGRREYETPVALWCGVFLAINQNYLEKVQIPNEN